MYAGAMTTSDALPPLNALRAFAAAARHLSFTRAAQELHVTQTAISHQMRVLEQHLGSPLFLRLPRRLALTPEGLAYARELGHVFERFYRGDQARGDARARDTAGSGLGLAIVRQIVQRHGGAVRAKAAVPRGLTIEIDLPQGKLP